ncbi:MAG: hypothetical protein U1F43_27020 [Myxococcota bacterium]
MTGIIRQSASAEAKIEDVLTTLQRCIGRHALDGDAQEFLSVPAAAGTASLASHKQAKSKVDELTVDCAVKGEALFQVHGVVREAYFNAGGRRRRDPLMRVVFIDNLKDLRKLEPWQLIQKIEQLADRIERTQHPRYTPEQAKGEADKLRAVCAAMKPAAVALAAAKQELATAASALGGAANLGRLELVSLKRHWQGKKMTNAAIHDIIPGHARSRRRREGGATSASATTANPPTSPPARPSTESTT